MFRIPTNMLIDFNSAPRPRPSYDSSVILLILGAQINILDMKSSKHAQDVRVLLCPLVKTEILSKKNVCDYGSNRRNFDGVFSIVKHCQKVLGLFFSQWK